MVASEAGGRTREPCIHEAGGQAAGSNAGHGRWRVAGPQVSRTRPARIFRLRQRCARRQMRLELFEIHDQPWFPDFLRREVLDALQMIFERTDTYRPIAGRLRAALDYAGTRSVLDLFSGVGGPWPSLMRLYESEGAPPIDVLLTDKFPAACNGNGDGTRSSKGMRFVPDPIDATAIPECLQGFRTIFSSFHHLNPAEALCLLQDSARCGRGIGIFEVGLDFCGATARLVVRAVPPAVSLVTAGVDLRDPGRAPGIAQRRVNFLFAVLFACGFARDDHESPY
jgi:hypothetical protein